MRDPMTSLIGGITALCILLFAGCSSVTHTATIHIPEGICGANIDLINVKQSPYLRLRIAMVESKIHVVVTNPLPRELKLWQTSNSWGYWMFSVVVRDDVTGDIFRIVPTRDVDFTKNGPSFTSIPLGADETFVLDLLDNWWDVPDGVPTCVGHPLSVRVVLGIDATDEATEYGVFVGEASSYFIASSPPHSWLPRSGPDKSKR